MGKKHKARKRKQLARKENKKQFRTKRAVQKYDGSQLTSPSGGDSKVPQPSANGTDRNAPSASILIVGDGDFSFSRGLIRKRGRRRGAGMVVTSYDSKSEVLAKYPQAASILAEVRKNRAKVLHSIDCRALHTSKALGGKTFDRVVFNFPHSGQQRVHVNKALLRDFFASAAQVLTPTGEIHVTLRDRPPYSNWKVEEQARLAGLKVVSNRQFDAKAFPGYKHATTLADAETFDNRFCRTRVFKPQNRPVGGCSSSSQTTRTTAGNKRKARGQAGSDDDSGSDSGGAGHRASVKLKPLVSRGVDAGSSTLAESGDSRHKRPKTGAAEPSEETEEVDAGSDSDSDFGAFASSRAAPSPADIPVWLQDSTVVSAAAPSAQLSPDTSQKSSANKRPTKRGKKRPKGESTDSTADHEKRRRFVEEEKAGKKDDKGKRKRKKRPKAVLGGADAGSARKNKSKKSHGGETDGFVDKSNQSKTDTVAGDVKASSHANRKGDGRENSRGGDGSDGEQQQQRREDLGASRMCGSKALIAHLRKLQLKRERGSL
jgi:hypothetical protein